MKAQLRMHPKVKYRGTSSWPPDLGGAYGPDDLLPVGEQGILKDVEMVPADLIGPQRLEVIVEHMGRKYAGQIWLDDTTLVPRLRTILSEHVGEPLAQIGGVELDS